MDNIIDDKQKGLPLVSLSDVQVYLKNDDDASLTAFLTSAINYVSQKFETYCNTSLSADSFTGVYNCNYLSGRIYTNNIPIISVDTLQYRSTLFTTWTDISSDYVYIYDNYIYLSSYVGEGWEYKMEYTAGYNTIPNDLKLICIEGVAEIYKQSQKGEGRLGLTNINASGGIGSESYNLKNLFDEHKETLELYRKMSI